LARADLEIGIVQAPFHPVMWAALGHTIFYGNVLGFDEEEGWMTTVYRHAQRSFELDHRSALGHVVMALHGLYQGELDHVIATCNRIEQDNAHAPSTLLSAGFFRSLAGDWDHGIEMLNSALSVLLHPPGWAYRATFLNHYRKKNYIEALYEIDNYHAPENFTPSLLRAAALAQLGRSEEASLAAAEVVRICPRFTEISSRYFRYLTAFDDIADHLMSGLCKAGLRL
jgi:tetratricopeptide (TPR) repeat protein